MFFSIFMGFQNANDNVFYGFGNLEPYSRWGGGEGRLYESCMQEGVVHVVL